MNKINSNSEFLSNIAIVKNGVQAYTVGEGKAKQTEQMKIDRVYHSTIKKDDSWIKYVDGLDVIRYLCTWERQQYIKYGVNLSRRREPELFIGER